MSDTIGNTIEPKAVPIGSDEDRIYGDRAPRTAETRAKTSRPPASFVPASMLPELESVDPDYVYRWVRVESKAGKVDTKNLNARMRAGWVPVKEAEFPELVNFPADNTDNRFEGLIQFGELLLCKIGKEHVAARRAYYRNMAQSQMTTVDNNFFRENDGRMPLFKEHQSVTKPTG